MKPYSLFLPIKSNKEGKKILRQLPNQLRVDYYLLNPSCWSICASKILPTTKGSIVSKENYEINILYILYYIIYIILYIINMNSIFILGISIILILSL